MDRAKLAIRLYVAVAVVGILQGVASGWGVGSPGTGLGMYPGETQVVNLSVQNGSGPTMNTAMTMTKNDGNIATFPDIEFTIDPGVEILVPVTITVPFDAEIGHEYGICVRSRGCEVDPNGGGELVSAWV
jgi:hypothetical protein